MGHFGYYIVQAAIPWAKTQYLLQDRTSSKLNIGNSHVVVPGSCCLPSMSNSYHSSHKGRKLYPCFQFIWRSASSLYFTSSLPCSGRVYYEISAHIHWLALNSHLSQLLIGSHHWLAFSSYLLHSLIGPHQHLRKVKAAHPDLGVIRSHSEWFWCSASFHTFQQYFWVKLAFLNIFS